MQLGNKADSLLNNSISPAVFLQCQGHGCVEGGGVVELAHLAAAPPAPWSPACR